MRLISKTYEKKTEKKESMFLQSPQDVLILLVYENSIESTTRLAHQGCTYQLQRSRLCSSCIFYGRKGKKDKQSKPLSL